MIGLARSKSGAVKQDGNRDMDHFCVAFGDEHGTLVSASIDRCKGLCDPRCWIDESVFISYEQH